MPVKAWLAGHSVDLESLAELFAVDKEPHVGRHDADYYLTSSAFDGISDGGQLHQLAASQLDKVNGTAWILRPGFRPVRLTGSFTDDTNDARHTVVVLTETASIRTSIGQVTVTVAGEKATTPGPPNGARYAGQMAAEHHQVSRVLHADILSLEVSCLMGEVQLDILGQQNEEPNWEDLYKVLEIVRAAVGGKEPLLSRGWITRSDLSAFTQSANRPEISPDVSPDFDLRC